MVVRIQGIDAGFSKPNYLPGDVAQIHIATDAQSLSERVFQSGPEKVVTYADNQFAGVEVDEGPTEIDWSAWRSVTHTITFRVPDLPSGLYYVQFTAADGRVGYAPFVVRPVILGQTSRVLVVLPTNTWQAYNFQDVNGDGYGDTWYAGPPNRTVDLGRTYIARGAPPRFYRYDLPFLHWLYWSGKQAEFISDSDFDNIATGEQLAASYDLIVFEGHEEYVRPHEYDVVQRFRDLGGNLMFLSANNFFWKVQKSQNKLVKIGRWRDAGRPEAALIGVEYRANDDGQRQGLFTVQNSAATPWLWEGTGLGDGSTFGQFVGGYGIEIDSIAPESPPGTVVVAQIPDLLGPGLTAQMSYYEAAGRRQGVRRRHARLRRLGHVLAGEAHARQRLGQVVAAVRLANLVRLRRIRFESRSVAPVEVARTRPEVLVGGLVALRHRGGCLFGRFGNRGRSGLVDERVLRGRPVERGLLRLDPGDTIHRLLDPRLFFRLEERMILERIVGHVLARAASRARAPRCAASTRDGPGSPARTSTERRRPWNPPALTPVLSDAAV